MSRCIQLAVVFALIFFIVGCEPTVTQENFDMIEKGMSLSQVEQILGSGTPDNASGVSFDASGVPSTTSSTRRTYLWEEDGMTITVIFEDGVVFGKRKAGF